MTLIAPVRIKILNWHVLKFNRANDPGRVYSFPSDEHGNVDRAHLSEDDWRMFNYCMESAGYTMFGPELVHYSKVEASPGLGMCECGRSVVLRDRFENRCKCHRCYDLDGKEVSPSDSDTEQCADSRFWD